MTSRPGGVDLDAILHRYLREVLFLETPSSNSWLRIPEAPTPLPAYDLRRALADPSILLEPSSRTVRQKMDELLIFARWLRAVPTEYIPRELASRAARFRFAIWSLPVRVGWPTADELYTRQVRWPGEEVQQVWQRTICDEARAAQQEWKRYLDAWEDDPWLATRHAEADKQLEDDLRWLTTTWPRTRRREKDHKPWPAPPRFLDLGSAADHSRIAADIVERHWLPRGSLLRATTALAPGNKRRWPLLAAYPTAAAAIIALLLCGHGDLARWWAIKLLAVGLIAAAILIPPRLNSVALLRVPATAAVGLALLVSLTPRWWTSSNSWLIGFGLLVAAAGYVVLEARMHGAQRLRAMGRGLLVTIVGALHAAVLSIAVLGFVAPAVGEHGACLDGWWLSDPWQPLPLSVEAPANAPADADSCAKALRTHQGGTPAGVLLFMTGWSFAVGLAAQILWDDRPITAPLGRLRRVRGGT